MSESGGSRGRRRGVYRRPAFLSVVAVAVVAVLVTGAYLALGCGRDWALLGGLLLDLLGAVALALPDLPRVSDRLRVGQLRAARRRLTELADGNGGTGSTVDHPAFREAVLEPLASERDLDAFDPDAGLPEGAAFEVESLGDGMRVQVYGHVGSTTPLGSVRYPVVMGKLRSALDRSEGSVRRSGLLLLFVGFSVQIAAVLQESNLFGICG